MKRKPRSSGRPAGRLQKNAAATTKKKDEMGAYDDEDDGVSGLCGNQISLRFSHTAESTTECTQLTG